MSFLDHDEEHLAANAIARSRLPACDPSHISAETRDALVRAAIAQIDQRAMEIAALIDQSGVNPFI